MPLHEPSPHDGGQRPQSDGQDEQVSPPPHAPLPQTAEQLPQAPQASRQQSPASTQAASHQHPPGAWFPQLAVSPQELGSAQAPQSDGHDEQVSVPLHDPSPQPGGQAPQSDEHDEQVSVPLHVP